MNCICGHLENHHYYINGKCGKVLFKYKDGEVQECGCKCYKPEIEEKKDKN